MSRQLSIAILVLAVLAVLAGLRFSQSSGSDEGCDGVRTIFERVSFVEQGGGITTSETYAATALEVRKAAVVAPAQVAEELRQLGDAYAQLGLLTRGFDPADDATYHVYEDNAGPIEAQQTVVDTSLPAVEGWLEARCM